MPTDNTHKVLAFYYGWYGMPKDGCGWHMWNFNEAGVEEPELSTQAIQLPHYPRNGFYNSNDDEVINTHLSLADEAGLNGLIVSWWGMGSRLNKSFSRMLELAAEHKVKLTIYYESSLAPGCIYFLVEDLARLLAEYGAHESFMKVGGLPVVFIYDRAIKQYSKSDWKRVIELLKKRSNVLLIADTSSKHLGKFFDGMHSYCPVGAIKRLRNMNRYYSRYVGACRKMGKIACATVTPGFDDTRNGAKRSWKYRLHQFISGGQPYILGRKEGRTYRSLWESAIRSDPNWILLTSFNEWIEGTEIEPSQEFGNQYIHLTRQYADEFRGRQK